ncbi:hypothetical protein [Endozoicomonas lisbonensis]|uniref:Uncharacterized protein n=1 Tax=Endozoicomonas lisbonensis TaxID=3120522 RepID=A0ABV2SAN0_9GAMM
MPVKFRLTHPVSGQQTWMFAPDKHKQNQRLSQTENEDEATHFSEIPYAGVNRASYYMVTGGTLYLDKQNSNSHLFLNAPIGNVQTSLIYAWRINEDTRLMEAIREPVAQEAFSVVKAKRSPARFDGTVEENIKYNKLNCAAFDKRNALIVEKIIVR